MHNLAISTNTTGAPYYRLDGSFPKEAFNHRGCSRITEKFCQAHVGIGDASQPTLGHRCMTSDSRDRYDEGVATDLWRKQPSESTDHS